MQQDMERFLILFEQGVSLNPLQEFKSNNQSGQNVFFFFLNKQKIFFFFSFVQK